MEIIQNLWNPENQRLLERIKKYILSGPTLEKLDPIRRFYIKTDWPKGGMGSVLLKLDISAEARKSEAYEKDGIKCEFDKSIEGMRLRPISFISISTLYTLEK